MEETMVGKSVKFSVLLSILALVMVLAACAPAAPAQPTQAPSAPAATEAPVATEAPAATQAPAATEAPAPAASAVSYATDVQPIFDQNCVKCHGGSDGKKGGLSLKSYDDLMKGGQDGQVIVPGDAANSMLVQAIAEGKMPKRAPKLPQAQIDTIAAWVNAGAENN
jgi:mono/diheme cytochrome c family protein